MWELPGPLIRFSWQPPHGSPEENSLATLRAMLPHLVHVHVFEWCPYRKPDFPLPTGKSAGTASSPCSELPLGAVGVPFWNSFPETIPERSPAKPPPYDPFYPPLDSQPVRT